MVWRYQTASLLAVVFGSTDCQLESSSEGDSPCATSPAWKRHGPLGRFCSESNRFSVSLPSGEIGAAWVASKSCALAAAGEVNATQHAEPTTKPRASERDGRFKDYSWCWEIA